MRTGLSFRRAFLPPAIHGRRARLLTEFKFALCIFGALSAPGVFLAVLHA